MGIAYGGVSESDVSGDGGGEFKLMPANKPLEFDIIDSIERTSKGGNPMFEVTLQPVADEWSNRKVWDYVVSGEWFDRKIGSILASAGKDYTRGGVIEAEHLIGLRVTCKLKHEEYNGKTSEKVSFYVPKSKPTNIVQAPIQQQQAVVQHNAPDSESVPF